MKNSRYLVAVNSGMVRSRCKHFRLYVLCCYIEHVKRRTKIPEAAGPNEAMGESLRALAFSIIGVLHSEGKLR